MMILSNNALASPGLVFKLNHCLSKWCLSTEIHLLDSLLKEFSIDFLKVDDNLNANIFDTLIILCKYD
jgi:hypothetical protein